MVAGKPGRSVTVGAGSSARAQCGRRGRTSRFTTTRKARGKSMSLWIQTLRCELPGSLQIAQGMQAYTNRLTIRPRSSRSVEVSKSFIGACGSGFAVTGGPGKTGDCALELSAVARAQLDLVPRPASCPPGRVAPAARTSGLAVSYSSVSIALPDPQSVSRRQFYVSNYTANTKCHYPGKPGLWPRGKEGNLPRESPGGVDRFMAICRSAHSANGRSRFGPCGPFRSSPQWRRGGARQASGVRARKGAPSKGKSCGGSEAPKG